jgi:hypothetical protein
MAARTTKDNLKWLAETVDLETITPQDLQDGFILLQVLTFLMP